MLFLLFLACAPGTLPIHNRPDGTQVCGSWQALQAYSRAGGPGPLIPLPLGSIRSEGGGTYMITRAAVDAVMGAGLGALARQARLESVFTDGRSSGFQISGLPVSSPFRSLGLTSGDVVHTINGLDLSNPLHMLALLAAVQSPNPSVSLKITRAGQPLALVWRVAEAGVKRL